MVGAAAVLVPGVGPVVVAGPLAAALMAGLEGAIAGTALGGLAGALVGWGVPKERALTYETHIQGGKFLVDGPRRPRGRRAGPRDLLAHHDARTNTCTSTSHRRHDLPDLAGPPILPRAAAGRPLPRRGRPSPTFPAGSSTGRRELDGLWNLCLDT